MSKIWFDGKALNKACFEGWPTECLEILKEFVLDERFASVRKAKAIFYPIDLPKDVRIGWRDEIYRDRHIILAVIRWRHGRIEFTINVGKDWD